MKLIELMKKTAVLFIGISLVLSSAAPVYAEPDMEILSETEGEVSIEENLEEIQDEETEEAEDREEASDEKKEEVETEKEVETEDGIETEEEVEVEEELELEMEEMSVEEAIAYEAANPSGFHITLEVSGSTVTSWKSDTGTYYLFLPNNVSIPDLTFSCDGISYVKSVSKGTYNAKTKLISGAFSKSGDSLTVTSGGGNKYKIVVMQTSIASVMIDLNGVSLDTINAGSKDTKYPGNTVTLIDTASSVSSYSNSVEVKGRGNTTWIGGTKKPYQIKFDSKVSVFGMDKAKKWVLLANAFDESMIRNELMFETSKTLGMDFTTDYEYANVWVDGTYIGTYMIGEKAEIGKGRLELTYEQGALFERDDIYYKEEQYYFTTSEGTFTVKESVSDDEASIQAAIESFREKYNGLISYLSNTMPEKVTVEGLSRYIDVESWVDYYLLVEFLRNPDGFNSSGYFYMDGPDDVIHYGPSWDYDASMGNPVYASISGTAGTNIKMSSLITKLVDTDAFSDYIESVYESNRSWFSGLSSRASELASYLGASADMNYTRWEYALGGRDSSKYGVKPNIQTFHNTYGEAISYLENWLAGRYRDFRVIKADLSVAASGGYIRGTLRNGSSYSKVSFAVWSDANGQDDLAWVSGSKQADGSWTMKYSVGKLKDMGKVFVHAYADGKLTDYITIFLEESGKAAELSIEDPDGKETDFQITYTDNFDYSSVVAAVWSEEGDQDDLIWYTLKQTSDGVYQTNVPVNRHKTAGTYQVHIYSGSKCLKTGTFTVSEPSNATITAKDNGDGTVTVVIKDIFCKSTISKVQVPVWSQKNDQDDLKWYTATKRSDGAFTVTFTIANHKGDQGEYAIHAYATGENGVRGFIGSTSCIVKADLQTSISATEINGGYQLSVKNTPANAGGLRFAVWGLENGQNDLKWYTAALDKASGTATYKWYGTLSSEEGEYAVHAYMVSESGSLSYLGATSFTRTNQGTGSLVLVKNNKGDFNIRIDNIQTSYKVASVKAAVWSSVNGQDDLKWYTIPYSGNSGNITKNISGHKNSKGVYNIHIYVRDSNGKQACIATGTITM